MFTAFSTALSGMAANAAAIDVISNNLANLNTTGYKASDAQFQDLMASEMGAGSGASQIGMGGRARSCGAILHPGFHSKYRRRDRRGNSRRRLFRGARLQQSDAVYAPATSRLIRTATWSRSAATRS